MIFHGIVCNWWQRDCFWPKLTAGERRVNISPGFLLPSISTKLRRIIAKPMKPKVTRQSRKRWSVEQVRLWCYVNLVAWLRSLHVLFRTAPIIDYCSNYTPTTQFTIGSPMTVTSSSCKLHPRGVAYHAECSTARAIYVDSVLLNTLVTNLHEPTKVKFSDSITHFVPSFHEGTKGTKRFRRFSG